MLRVLRMNAATKEFLDVAAELGLTVVGIGNVRHPLLENLAYQSQNPDQIFGVGEVCVSGPDCDHVDFCWTRQAVWVLAERTGRYLGCGNTAQAQASTIDLDAGVYVRLIDGWGRMA